MDEENEENEESDVDEELELELANLQKEGQAWLQKSPPPLKCSTLSLYAV